MYGKNMSNVDIVIVDWLFFYQVFEALRYHLCDDYAVVTHFLSVVALLFRIIIFTDLPLDLLIMVPNQDY